MKTDSTKSSFFSWKFFLILFLAIFGFKFFYESKKELKPVQDSIGKIVISGQIMDSTEINKILNDVLHDVKIKALIIEINSPGGAVIPSYEIYDQIRKISENNKPVVALMKSVAASGGYLISIASDHIIAHPSTLTGSIGAIFYSFDLSNLMDKVGVKQKIFRSGDLKALPSPGEKITPEANKILTHFAEETKNQFLNLVLEKRKITDTNIINQISRSAAYIGTDAKNIGLIDELGNIDAAINWLKSVKKIDLPIFEINTDDKKNKIWRMLKSKLHLENTTDLILKNVIEKLNLDKKGGIYLLSNI
jgi:protease-4